MGCRALPNCERPSRSRRRDRSSQRFIHSDGARAACSPFVFRTPVPKDNSDHRRPTGRLVVCRTAQSILSRHRRQGVDPIRRAFAKRGSNTTAGRQYVGRGAARKPIFKNPQLALYSDCYVVLPFKTGTLDLPHSLSRWGHASWAGSGSHGYPNTSSNNVVVAQKRLATRCG